MATNPTLEFLRDPAPDARRAEFEAFAGPNAATFLPAYDQLRSDALAGDKPKFRFNTGGFVWQAFLFGPVWFLYRKMWLVGGIIVALMVAISLIPGTSRAGLPLGLMLGLLARRTYVQHAIGLLQKHRVGGTVDAATIAHAGGVSRLAGWISGTIYAVLTATALAAMIYLINAGAPLPT